MFRSLIDHNPNQINNMIRLSSRLTFIYRFIIPVVLVLAWVMFALGCILLLPKKYTDFNLVFIPLVGLLFGSIIVPFLRLRNVFFDDKTVRISDGNRVLSEVAIEDVISIDRYFYFFYKIVLYRDKTYQGHLMLPKIEEATMTFGLMDGASIKGFRRRIKR